MTRNGAKYKETGQICTFKSSETPSSDEQWIGGCRGSLYPRRVHVILIGLETPRWEGRPPWPLIRAPGRRRFGASKLKAAVDRHDPTQSKDNFPTRNVTGCWLSCSNLKSDSAWHQRATRRTMSITRQKRSSDVTPGRRQAFTNEHSKEVLKLPLRMETSERYSSLRGNEAGVWKFEMGRGLSEIGSDGKSRCRTG